MLPSWGELSQLMIALATLGTFLMSYQAQRAAKQAVVIGVENHKATNSLVTKLVETTKTEAHAAGVKDERDRTDALPGNQQ